MVSEDARSEEDIFECMSPRKSLRGYVIGWEASQRQSFPSL